MFGYFFANPLRVEHGYELIHDRRDASVKFVIFTSLPIIRGQNNCFINFLSNLNNSILRNRSQNLSTTISIS